MRGPHLFGIAALTAALAAGTACNRGGDDAREAAADLRGAASRAGDRLADSWLTARVQARYFADDTIKARYIDVSSRDGVVTLEGYVENDDVRQRARQIAEATEGVSRVDDQLMIGQAPQQAAARSREAVPTTGAVDTTYPQTPGSPAAAIDDATITSLIQAKYFLHDQVKGRHIEVGTDNGVVTLRGRVGSDEERAAALLMARTTDGVQRVEDGLTVDATLSSDKPQPSAAGQDAVGTTGVRGEDATLESAVKGKIGGAQVQGIDVIARDGVVLLQGQVANQSTKQRVLTMARETEGVVQVVDRLSVGAAR